MARTPRGWWYRGGTADGGNNDVMAVAAGDSRWDPTRKPHRRVEEDKGWHPKPPFPRRLPKLLRSSRSARAPEPVAAAPRPPRPVRRVRTHQPAAGGRGKRLLPSPPWLTNRELCSWSG
ncbi:hypothetical protein Scep_020046 [Stephania cephalantha]|uniref:Uncharacterized protein n=1 Tax=Stephania cephalantha TaxID=152367 RepID=A0AAP0IC63_9MAGN